MNQNYDKNHPFLGSIVERYCLNSNSTKKTYHLSIDLSSSGIEYKVGDSLAIFPSNNRYVVENILKSLRFQGDETVINRKGQSFPISIFLKKQANLTKLPKKILQLAIERLNNSKKMQLENLLMPENKEALTSYLESSCIEDFLFEYADLQLNPQELCDLCFPLLPRFYSIASSMNSVGEQAHLTIALSEYQTHQQVKKGVCSQFLCEEAPLNEPIIPLYLQSSEDFTLPSNSENKPIIMVGPGTGVAPFRGFMQERVYRGASTKNWLFFGERNQHSDFFYADFWSKLSVNGLIKIDTAFSRDQEHKIYVQDRLLEKGPEVWQWLQEGAYFFVCGDAKKMAKDVDFALQRIIEREGKKSSEDARQYLKDLRSERRYLRDVY